MKDNPIIDRIKKVVKEIDPNAEVILYGSYARGDQHENSDIDLLILVDQEQISFDKKLQITYPLYDIEIETGQLIHPVVLAKKDWYSKHRITPFYENVSEEGVLL